jgi:predicted hotdog family 3-hydroxylacyl-ACP dehydratase
MLDRACIAARIPHAGRMCLLDRVLDFDARGIRCAASGHREADHPLRERGGLPVWAGVEYAAQAAAVHGALLHADARPRPGFLGGLRGVRAGCEWLDRIDGDLLIEATVLHRDPAGGIYAFETRGGGALLLQGRITLVFARTPGEARA